MANLLVVRGRDQGKRFEFADVCDIGRDAKNRVQLLDGEASRRHATISPIDGRWQIEDHNSSNGTRVNDSVVDRSLLDNGDRIEIGSTTLVFTAIESHGGSTFQAAGGSDRRHNDRQSSNHGVEIITGHGDKTRMPDVSRIVSRMASATSSPAIHSSGGSAFTSDSPNIDANQSLEVMYHASLAVGRNEDLEQVLSRVLQLVFDWTEADRGCIMLRSEHSDAMQPAARCDRGDVESQKSGAHDLPPRSSDEPIAISRTILDYVLTSQQGVRTSDAQDDKRFDEAASILQGRVREAICVPLQGRYGIVGALYIDTDSSPGQIVQRGTAAKFNDDHLRLMTAIGHQAAIAIEDTQHYSQLLQSERLAAMGQTIATLSHHIKNILQGIRGGSYLIQTGLDRDDDKAVRRGWSIVDRNQTRISNLVMDMLTYSKERTPELVRGDLNETVADVVELMSSAASEQNVTMHHTLDETKVDAVFDADAMHRAVMNLVTNAIDAAVASETTPSQVFVRTLWSDQGWIIEVGDTGPGIAPEDRDRIFSLFESGKGSRGTGLGLPVCAKIMEEHQGRIEVDEPPGGNGGAIFRLVLPPMEKDTGETLLGDA